MAGYGAKMRTLERRKVHLQKQIDEGRFSTGSLPFLYEEIEALDLALAAMAANRRKLKGLPSALDVLRDLVAAYDRGQPLTVQVQAARAALQEADA